MWQIDETMSEQSPTNERTNKQLAVRMYQPREKYHVEEKNWRKTRNKLEEKTASKSKFYEPNKFEQSMRKHKFDLIDVFRRKTIMTVWVWA